MANHGMVASGHPLASMAGMRILEKGGNAADAAVAAWTVQGLVEPGMTGLGSDAFVMIYLAKSGQVKFINGTGPAPGGATPELYKAKGGIPGAGPLASDVPGALDGIGLALESYGTFSYADAFAPAIEIAKKGFPVSYHLAGQLERRQQKLAAFASTKAIWFRDVISSHFQSSFWPHEAANKLRVPSSLPEHVLEALAAKGHDLEIRDYRGVGSVKAVLIDLVSGALMGGVSPTGDSYVIGW